MSTSPAPRWRFRYSLRTLFIAVAIVAAWFSWERKFVSDRKEMMDFAVRNGGILRLAEDYPLDPDAPAIPWWREQLGDKAVYAICIGPRKKVTDEQVAAAHNLFPETDHILPHLRSNLSQP